jgi:predicted porin
MNRTATFLAALALTAATGPAAAQSDSVTIFGVLDLAARAVENDDTMYRLESDGLSSSRLGFRGVEDLGGGLKAGFWLEGSLAVDTGTQPLASIDGGRNNAAGIFQRRATVSLMGGFGELRLGRDKVPTNLTWDEFDPFRDTGVGRSSRLSAASGIGSYAFSRTNNAVGYFTPAMGGFFGQAMVAAGENTNNNKYEGVRGGYRAGPLMAAFTFANADSSSGDEAAIWSVGGTYDFKSFKLWGFYNEVDDLNAGQTNWLLGATVPVGGFELRASYQAMSGDEGIGNQEADMFALGAVYNLSKRTALYATYSAISNTNTSFTVAAGGPLTRGNDSSGYEFGIRHSF